MVVKYANKNKPATGGGAMPKDNLYLTGVPSAGLDDDSLKAMFAEVGLQATRTRIFPDTRGTGSCAAMVQLATPEQASLAIQMLNGRGKMTVNYAAEKASENVQLVVKYAGTDAQGPSDNLFISGLPVPVRQPLHQRP